MPLDEGRTTVDSRRRIILYLIEKFLSEKGYSKLASTLKTDAHLCEYEVCDNIDLDSILLEYCSYYQLKFDKTPHILKKSPTRPVDKEKKKHSSLSSLKNINSGNKCKLEEPLPVPVPVPPSSSLNDTLQITPAINDISNKSTSRISISKISLDECLDIPPDWKELGNVVCNNLIKNDFGLRWSDIIGNTNAITIIKEAAILPVNRPDLFEGTLLTPWKSVLLHGPSGSGKTLIAKTLCSETLSTTAFFNISSSTITSKWRGESEKLINLLFKTAKHYAPSIIFIDEVEGLTSKRDCGLDHDASVRFKNEFLSLMDGLQDNNKGVFILANTNLPWIIDDAFLRRFEKKIFVDLPNFYERISLVHHFVAESIDWSQDIIEQMASKMEGFTGDDIRNVCKEARMSQIRNKRDSDIALQKTSTLKPEEICKAIEQIQPNTEVSIEKHKAWNIKYGSKFFP